MRRVHSLLVLLSLPLAPSVNGDPDGGAMAALEAKKKAFEASVATVLEPVNRKYAAALRRLEKQYALEKNYEAAIAVRDERLAVERVLDGGVKVAENGSGGSNANVSESPSTAGWGTGAVLTASAATLADGAVLDGDAVKLSAPDQSAEWSISGLAPGGYDVVVTYSSKTPAVFQVKEHFFRLNCEAAPADGKPVSFGTLKVTSRATSILLTAKRANAGSPLLVKQVSLLSVQ